MKLGSWAKGKTFSWNIKIEFTCNVQFSSFAQLCPTLCNCMDCSTPGFPVQHQLPKLAQTHVHQVSDAIQLSHLLSSPSPTFNLSQHQGLYKWVSSSHQLAKVLLPTYNPRWLSGKESTCQCRRCRRRRFDPWLGRSSGGENGNPLQYSCLENPVDVGACQATVHGVAKSWTQLSMSMQKKKKRKTEN